jgi:poly-gamma-glutamate synthesis protein (capsule biosynthesis protein)
MDGRDLTLVATGDSMITKRVSVLREKQFLDMMDVIRSGDAIYTNLEMLIHDYEGYPGHSSGGTYMRAPYFVLEELKWMGFNIVSTANNHAMDYTFEGLLTTIKNLERAGLPHCGTGRDLAEARAPAFLDTAKGRVGLISLDSSGQPHAPAGQARKDMQGRPGLNPLRAVKKYTLDRESWRSLLRLVKALDPLGFRGWEAEPIGSKTKELELFGVKFAKGKKTEITSVPNQSDIEGNLRSVREARRQADWVLIAHHTHWRESTNPQAPAKFLQSFARKCLNEGEDAYIGHGAHLLQGIEIYKRKPIFYSLGNLIIQQSLVSRLPASVYESYNLDPEATPQDAFDMRNKKSKAFRKMMIQDPQFAESVIAVCDFKDHELRNLKLYPIEMGFGKRRHQFGTPMLTDAQRGKAIINRLARLSKTYGTEISFREGIGHVTLP